MLELFRFSLALIAFFGCGDLREMISEMTSLFPKSTLFVLDKLPVQFVKHKTEIFYFESFGFITIPNIYSIESWFF